jgi:hypothetical protein
MQLWVLRFNEGLEVWMRIVGVRRNIRDGKLAEHSRCFSVWVKEYPSDCLSGVCKMIFVRRAFAFVCLTLALYASAMAQHTFPTTSILYARSLNTNTLAKYDAMVLAGRQPTPVNFVMYANGACDITSATGGFLRAATYTRVSSTQIDVVLTPGQGQLLPVIYRFWLTPGTTNSWYGFALFNGVPSYTLRANF